MPEPRWILPSGVEPPNDMCCPITFALFVQPVVLDGIIMEKSMVDQWFKTARRCLHPVRRAPIIQPRYQECGEMRDLVRAFAGACGASCGLDWASEGRDLAQGLLRDVRQAYSAPSTFFSRVQAFFLSDGVPLASIHCADDVVCWDLPDQDSLHVPDELLCPAAQELGRRMLFLDPVVFLDNVYEKSFLRHYVWSTGHHPLDAHQRVTRNSKVKPCLRMQRIANRFAEQYNLQRVRMVMPEP